MTDIEKVARALCDDAGCVWDMDPQSLSRAEWRKAACAAIAAMQPAPQEPVGSAAEITRLTEALRAAEEEKKGLREALIKAEEPHWFYAEGHEERCLYSPDDAIDLLDFDAGEYVTEVATARPCRSIWCAVRVTDDEDADERFTFTEHDSEEAARQALAGAKP